jgi:hypothetical protein
MGSDLSDFLRQLPTGLIVMFCGSGILLVLVVMALIYMRRQKAQAAAFSGAQPMTHYAAPAANLHDMPDLDSLVGGASPPEPAPPVRSMPSASLPATSAPPPRAPRKGAFNIALNDGATVEAVEVMAILRDVVDGRLIVQIGEKAYVNLSGEPDLKDRFTRVMRELAQVVATKPAASPTAPPEPSPSQTPTVEQPAVSALESEPAVEIPPATTAPIQPPSTPKPSAPPAPVAPPGQMPGDLPKFSTADMEPLSMRRRGKREVKPVPEINIAGAIEAYLQHKLSHTPEYANRSIHIYPAPDGGVSIEVDGQYFEAVGDVTDLAIREFLANTIQEWQDRH